MVYRKHAYAYIYSKGQDMMSLNAFNISAMTALSVCVSIRAAGTLT